MRYGYSPPKSCASYRLRAKFPDPGPRARAFFLGSEPRGLLNLFVNLPKSANRGGGYAILKTLTNGDFFGRFRAGVCFPGGRFLSGWAFAFRAGIFFPGGGFLSGQAFAFRAGVISGFSGFSGSPKPGKRAGGPEGVYTRSSSTL